MKIFKNFFVTIISSSAASAVNDLEALLLMHSDFIESEEIAAKVANSGIRRVTHWPNKRVAHAVENLKKMKKAFHRCGSENDSYSQISALSSDICEASDEILSSFSRWAQAYLSGCRNNQKHIERMDMKWTNIYNEVLGCTEAIKPTTSSTTTTTTTSTSTTTLSNPNTHRICKAINSWTSDCPKCYTYVHENEDDHFYNYETEDYYNEPFTCEFSMSTVCDANFRARELDCNVLELNPYLCDMSNEILLQFGYMSDEGFKTPLNCPACGCGENGPVRMDERTGTRSLTDEEIKNIRNSRKKN